MTTAESLKSKAKFKPKFDLGDEVFVLLEKKAVKAFIVEIEFCARMVEIPEDYPPNRQVHSRCTYRVQIDLLKRKIRRDTSRWSVSEDHVFATKEELVNYITS